MKQQPLKHPRRIAFSEVMTTDGQCLTRYVIELSEDATVSDLYPLTHETAFTEWMPGRVLLRDDHGLVHAYYQDKMIH